MGETSIQWTNATWNPIRGCSRLSPGCGGANHQGGCYAEKIAARFSGPGQPFEGFAKRTAHGGAWTGKVEVVWDQVEQPIRWRKPRMIFANSMSDLFHEDLDMEEVAAIYGTAIAAVHLRKHTIQILTKRSGHMRKVLHDEHFWDVANETAASLVMEHVDPLDRRSDDARATCDDYGPDKPPPGIWLGVSVEDVERKHRIDDLRATPAAVRFLSCEPLLEDLGPLNLDGIHQVIVGGESGPKSRPFWAPWARSILLQCRKARVACFIKQMGANVRDRNDAGFDDCDNGWNLEDEVAQVEHDINGYSEEYQGAPVRIRLKDKKGGDMAEWPADLRVREFPT
jgi:protein gp37